MKSMDELYGGPFPVVRKQCYAGVPLERIQKQPAKKEPQNAAEPDENEEQVHTEEIQEPEKDEVQEQEETGLSVIDVDSLKNVTPKRFLWSSRK